MSKVLWILLVSVLRASRIEGFSITITRGYIDSMRANIRQTPTDGLICSHNTGVCQCSGRYVGTYIFDSDSLTGKCVKDHEIIKDRSIGKFLPAQQNKCIGVTKDDKINLRLNCDENDLAVKWIWTLHGQMLNLKTLKCLKVESTRRLKRRIISLYLLEQCNMNNLQQIWECTLWRRKQYVTNNGTRLSRIKPGKDDSYFQACQNIYSYKGCYRFSDGNFIKLINGTRCDTRHNGTCGLEIKLQAPIGKRHTSCQLDWPNSFYTISSYFWYPFSEALEGVLLNTAVNPVTLEIKNSSLLLSKWKGHLLRLSIQCTNNVGSKENHCALLKVQGTATEQIPVAHDPSQTLYPPLASTTATTSPPTSLTQLNPTTSITSKYEINMKSTSTSSFSKHSSTGTSYPNINSENRELDGENLSIILPVVISAVVLFCLLLAVIVYKRRQKKKTTANTENQNEEHIYEEAHPGDNGPVSPIYMEIDNVRRSKKSNSSSKKRNKSQSNYQEPTESPFYHTLERPDGVENKEGIYEELDKVEKPPTSKAFEKEVDI